MAERMTQCTIYQSRRVNAVFFFLKTCLNTKSKLYTKLHKLNSFPSLTLARSHTDTAVTYSFSHRSLLTIQTVFWNPEVTVLHLHVKHFTLTKEWFMCKRCFFISMYPFFSLFSLSTDQMQILTIFLFSGCHLLNIHNPLKYEHICCIVFKRRIVKTIQQVY